MPVPEALYLQQGTCSCRDGRAPSWCSPGLTSGGTCPSTPRCVFLLLLPSSPGLVAAFVRRLRCRHLFSSSLDPHSFRCLVSLFPFDRSTLIHHQLGPPSATPAVLIIHRPVPRHNTTTTSDSDSRKFPICNKGYIPAGDNWRVGFYHGCVTERSLVCTTKSHFDRCNHHSIYLVPQLPARIVFRPAFLLLPKDRQHTSIIRHSQQLPTR